MLVMLGSITFAPRMFVPCVATKFLFKLFPISFNLLWNFTATTNFYTALKIFPLCLLSPAKAKTQKNQPDYSQVSHRAQCQRGGRRSSQSVSGVGWGTWCLGKEVVGYLVPLETRAAGISYRRSLFVEETARLRDGEVVRESPPARLLGGIGG